MDLIEEEVKEFPEQIKVRVRELLKKYYKLGTLKGLNTSRNVVSENEREKITKLIIEETK